MPNTSIKPLKLLLLALILADISAAQSAQTAEPSAAISQLEHEFSGSYAENALPAKTTHTIELIAAESDWGIISPYNTRVWSYNGTVPGPVIRIKLGDTLKVILRNNLPQPTTLHWHGVRVPNAMDGVPGVTQPEIKPGESFTYEFTPKDAGTFWFHPHLNAAEQIERGLQGVLIVEDPAEPKYSQDLVWVLDDWLLEKGAKIYGEFVTGHDLMHDGRWGNLLSVNGKYQPVIAVKAGERLRIRMVNAANGRVFMPAFFDLSANVIAVDGMLVQEPFILQGLLAAPGNRIDVDITIPKNSAGKTLAVIDNFSDKPVPLAFLQVDAKAAVKTPNFPPPKTKHFPNWDNALATPIAHEFHLNATRGGEYGITWSIDKHSGHGSNLFDLPVGRFQHLRITNDSYRLHPMHLHGQFFKLLAVDGRPVRENFWRDTLLVGPKQSVDIGLIPIDKGSWAFHCHVLEHAEAGMMSTLGVK